MPMGFSDGREKEGSRKGRIGKVSSLEETDHSGVHARRMR